MALALDQNTGYFEVTYAGPWGGLHVQAPENLIDEHFFPAIKNFFLRNSEIRSRPNLTRFLLGPDDGAAPILGVGTFMDANAVIHTVCWTAKGLFQLNTRNQPAVQQPWTYVGGPTVAAGSPVSWWSFTDVLFYTNGSPLLLGWDGIISSPASCAVLADGTTIGGFYLGQVDSHLLLASTVEQKNDVITTHPQRVRWSASGLTGFQIGTGQYQPNNAWDPTVNTDSGYEDFLDCPDAITGMMSIGRFAYIFRTRGVTAVTPTGNALAPFDFDPLWASNQGIGDVYPFTAAQYGNLGFFVSTEEVYMVNSYSFQEIGGGSRDAIMRDLAAATNSPIATVIPSLKFGYVWLTFHLSIPLNGFTRTYIYDVQQNNWQAWEMPELTVTGAGFPCWR